MFEDDDNKERETLHGDKSDLTRIEDLEDFLHEEDDPEIEAKLTKAHPHEEEETKESEDEGEELQDLSSSQDPLLDTPTNPDHKLDSEFLDEGNESEESFQEQGDFGNEEDFEEQDDFGSEEDFEEQDDFGNEENFEEQDDFGNEENFEEQDDFGSEENFEDQDDFDSEENFKSEENFEDQVENEGEFAHEDNFSNQEFEEKSIPKNIQGNIQESPSSPKKVQEPQTQSEHIQEIKDFGQAINYGVIKSGGNPPYALVLEDIKYKEDAEDIMILLRQYGLVSNENEQVTEQGLQSGHLLISQISEYSAIFMAHKLRRFDLNIKIGLSDQLHPSQNYKQDSRGLISKFNLKQDRTEYVKREYSPGGIEDILISTTSELKTHEIIDYIKVLRAHHLISEKDLQNFSLQDKKKKEKSLMASLFGKKKEEKEKKWPSNHPTHPQRGLEAIYQQLTNEIQNQAYKCQANGIVALHYKVDPLMIYDKLYYKILCTGNAVILRPLNLKSSPKEKTL